MTDAIVATSADILNFTLLTSNISDFKKIPQLKIINLWEHLLTKDT
jgi:hypothetical protein